MDNKKIYFRVDGGQQIGLGHIVRCTALAQMLCEDFDIEFVCKEIPESNVNELKDVGFSVLIIKNEEDLLKRLTYNDIVVIDHYGLDSNYQQRIKELGSKLVCIDDLHEKQFFADLIINIAPNINANDYQAQIFTQFALGLDYALLRPVFLKKAAETKTKGKINVAFVCFGGSDFKNITQTVVDILKDDLRFKKIIVVVGASYSYWSKLKASISSDTRIDLYNSIGDKKMSELMTEADLAIVPSSGILLEVLAIGCTVISGMYVDNQKEIFKDFKSLGAFESAEDFSKMNLTVAIDKCFENPITAPKLIDGKSPKRIKAVFKQLAEEHLVFLKRISKNDVDRTFEWASNKEIRKFSFNQEPIEYEDHKRWFISKLDNEKCFYYLGLFDTQIFGSVRFDIEDRNAKISYLVDPTYQGRGLGTILLKKGLETLLEESPVNLLTVWGEVLNQNQASIKIFERLGYSVQTSASNNFIRFEKKIMLPGRIEDQ